MSEEMSQPYIKARSVINSSVTLIISVGVVGLIAGLLGGTMSGQFMARQKPQSTNQPGTKETREIIVSKEGLVFKMEDGTPIAKLGVDPYGAYLNLLSKDNKPVTTLTEDRGQGMITIDSTVGTSVYIKAYDEGGNITMVGKYGKEVVNLSSYTSNGGGALILSEGLKGYKAIDIGTVTEQNKFKGTLTISNETGTLSQVPK